MKVNKKCESCGLEFSYYRSGYPNRRFCSKKCYWVSMKNNKERIKRKWKEFKKFIKNYKMDEEVKQVLLGSMLGDGSLSFNGSFGVSFRETHSIKQKEYLLWKKNILMKIFNTEISFGVNNGHKFCELKTLSHFYLKKLHLMFYPSGKGSKRFSIKILKQLKPLGLAVWYCDDGCYDYRHKVCFFAIHNEDEIKIIRKYFLDKWNLKTRPSKKYYIYFLKKDRDRFINLIKNHILKMPYCMHYKLGLNKEKIMENKIKNRKYYQNNKEKIRKNHNELYQNNKERYKRYSKKHYWKNREKKLIRQKKYWDKNRDKINKRKREKYGKDKKNINRRVREKYKNNRDKILKRAKIWREKNKDKIKEYNRKSYLKHREERLKKCKEYYYKRKERIR